MDNWIYAYYQKVKNGTEPVGRWVALFYEKIVTGIESKEYIFDQKKANAAVDWIESHCHHTEGPLAPGLLKLELWQKAMVSAIFGIINPKDGLRQFREIVLVVARKNGKSLLAAAIGAYEFFIDGGYGTRVYCLAPKLDQAEIIYNDIWTMIALEPGLLQRKEVPKEEQPNTARHRMTDLFIESSNSTVKKIAFSAKKSDGFNPSLTICDEIASWQGEQGLRQYEVMKSGMGARPEGLLLSCTTSGYINDSIFDELVKRSTRFLLGESKERRLMPLLYMIDDAERWSDINELRKSNPNLGVSVSVDYLLEEIAIAEGSLSKKAEFLTKYCCIKQNSSLAWLSSQTVERATGDKITLDDFRDCYCVAGIDLSQTTDLTAACVVIERDGRLNVIAKAWLPGEKIDEATARDGVPYNAMIQRGLMAASGDNFIDYHDVFDWFRELVEIYHIYPLKVGYDRYSSQYLVQDMKTYGFHMDDVFQGENLYSVLMEAEGMMKDGKINFGDNDLVKMHALNSAIKMSAERGRGKLVKLSANAHIDLMAAIIDAMTVRQKYYAEIAGQLANNKE